MTFMISKPQRIRLIAACVIAGFLSSEMAFAAPAVMPSVPAFPKLAIADVIADPSRLDLPLDNVILKEVHAGKSGKLIIHIQDAHANLSGQQNLAKTLDHLMTRYDLSLVLVEGSARETTLDEVRNLAPLEEWKIIARRFLFDGTISGEEYLNLTSEHKMKIVGVEYRDLYDDSLRAYASLVDKRKDILHYLYKAKTSVDQLKHKHYPQLLLDFEKNKRQDALNETDFQSSFEALFDLAKEIGYSMREYGETEKLIAMRDQEKALDLEKINAEQKQVLELLNQAGAKEFVERYSDQSKNLNGLHMSQYRLLQSVFDEAVSQHIAMDKFPAVGEYREYLKGFLDIDMDLLMKELEILEDELYGRILTTSDAKTIRAIDRFLGLLGNAYKLQMSSDEFETYYYNKKDFPTESWLAFLNRRLADAGFFESMVPYKPYLDEAQKGLTRFYSLVDERDHAFIENASRIMAKEKQKAAVLIAGGYHTEHLTQLLQSEDASYAVLTPIVTDKTDHEKYERLLLEHLQTIDVNAGHQGSDSQFQAQNVAPTKIPRGLRLAPLMDQRPASPARNLAEEIANQRVPGLGARMSTTLDQAASSRPQSELGKRVERLFEKIIGGNEGASPEGAIEEILERFEDLEFRQEFEPVFTKLLELDSATLDSFDDRGISAAKGLDGRTIGRFRFIISRLRTVDDAQYGANKFGDLYSSMYAKNEELQIQLRSASGWLLLPSNMTPESRLTTARLAAGQSLPINEVAFPTELSPIAEAVERTGLVAGQTVPLQVSGEDLTNLRVPAGARFAVRYLVSGDEIQGLPVQSQVNWVLETMRGVQRILSSLISQYRTFYSSAAAENMQAVIVQHVADLMNAEGQVDASALESLAESSKIIGANAGFGTRQFRFVGDEEEVSRFIAAARMSAPQLLSQIETKVMTFDAWRREYAPKVKNNTAVVTMLAAPDKSSVLAGHLLTSDLWNRLAIVPVVSPSKTAEVFNNSIHAVSSFVTELKVLAVLSQESGMDLAGFYTQHAGTMRRLGLSSVEDLKQWLEFSDNPTTLAFYAKTALRPVPLNQQLREAAARLAAVAESA